MAIEMKKRGLLIAASVAALILAAALAGLAGCQIGMEEFLEVPNELPLGTIVQTADGSVGFRLTWVRGQELLPQDEVMTDDVIIAACQETYVKFQEYIMMIDPLPFYDKDGDGISPFGPVGGSKVPGMPGSAEPYLIGYYNNSTGLVKIDNSNPGGKGEIVLHRYRPKIIDKSSGKLVNPGAATWRSTEAARAKAFKKAVAEFEAMMAALERSPFYEIGETETAKPLKNLRNAMAECIAYNPPLAECKQRNEFTFSDPGIGVPGRTVMLDAVHDGRRTTGILYEYYLGHVPSPDEYMNPKGNMMFLEHDKILN